MLQAEIENFLVGCIKHANSIRTLLATQQKLCVDWAEEIKTRRSQSVATEKQSDFPIHLNEMIETREQQIQLYIHKLSQVEFDQLAKDCENYGLKDLFEQFIESHRTLLRFNELIQVALIKLTSNVAENLKYIVQMDKMSSIYRKKPINIYHAESSRFFDQRR